MKDKKATGVENHYYVNRPKSKREFGLIRSRLRGRLFEFLTSSSVFSRKRIDLGTRLLVEAMILPEKGCLLDLGCGYGPVGIVAATLHPRLRVVMVDSNERAVWLARENARRNGTFNVECRRGFLYELLEDIEFAAILSNPPISVGKHVLSSLVRGAIGNLERNGMLELVVRSRVGGKYLLKELDEHFGNVEVLGIKSGYRVLLSRKP